MTTTAFDPGELAAVRASLNHVAVGSTAGPDVRGRLAQDVCSRNALHTPASGDAATAHSAEAALRTFGKWLGALIATLRNPATAAEQADSTAGRGFLEHWLTIDSIWLAGGLLAGPGGQRILDGVHSLANDMEHPCQVGVLLQPELAPLIGAHPAPASAPADEVRDAVAAALIPGVKAAAVGRRHVFLIVSVASSVQDGLPVDDGQGIRGSLAHHPPAVVRRIEAATIVIADLRYVHDGTAAAFAPPTANSATITVAMWPGVGFLPSGSPCALDILQRKGGTP